MHMFAPCKILHRATLLQTRGKLYTESGSVHCPLHKPNGSWYLSKRSSAASRRIMHNLTCSDGSTDQLQGAKICRGYSGTEVFDATKAERQNAVAAPVDRSFHKALGLSKFLPVAGSMFEDEITPAEEESLKKFRCLIAEKGLRCPEREDDQFLLRFLRARLLDLRRAALMYGEYIRWRKDNNVASVLQNFSYPEIDQVLEAWPQTWHKTDKMGRPINIQLFSRLSVDAMFQATTEERLQRRAIWVLEELHEVKLPACSKAAGHYIGRVTAIIDLHNVGISTFSNAHVRRILSNLAHVFSQYYPEYLGRLIIINAPVTFKIIWQMLCPFMDEKTRKKIRIHRGNGIEDLLSTIDEENLPAFLGGKCQCAGGGCEKFLTGPWNDSSHLQQ